MNRFQLISFDLDDTLWDVESIILRAEAQMMRFLENAYPELPRRFSVLELRALKEQVLQTHPEVGHDITLLRTLTLKEGLRQSGYGEAETEAGAGLAFDVYFKERNRVELFPAVAQILQDLAQEYPLYALSNGNADIQMAGIGHFFVKHYSARDVGVAKPDPAIYRAALAHAGVSAADALHIGDHPINDIASAQAIGMRTLWVNLQGKEWKEPVAPDASIQHFTELKVRIRQLEETRKD